MNERPNSEHKLRNFSTKPEDQVCRPENSLEAFLFLLIVFINI